MRCTFVLFLAAKAALLTASANAQPYNVTVAGYSPGGMVSTVSAGMDAALAAAFPGSAVTYQTSSGGLANAALVAQRKVPMGMIADHEVPQPWFGREPFKQPLKQLRLLFRPYTAESRFYISHVLANNDWAKRHGIRTLADIAGRKPPMRIAVNRPGNNDAEVSLAILREAGVTPQLISDWGGRLTRAASREMVSLMLDRRLDLIAIGISFNHPSIHQLDNGLDLAVLPISKDVATKVGEEWAGKACVMTVQEYKFVEQDTWGACIGLGIYVHEAAEDAFVRNLMTAFFDHADRIRQSHRLLEKVVTPQSMAEPGLIPHHRAAAQFLKERRLLK